MIEVCETQTFSDWLEALRDSTARHKIQARLVRVRHGNFGDHRENIAKGVCELKIDYGPGYRVYYAKRGRMLVILLCGGDKDTQKADIATAEKMAKELEK